MNIHEHEACVGSLFISRLGFQNIGAYGLHSLKIVFILVTNVRPDVDTLIVFLKEFLKNLILKKSVDDNKSMKIITQHGRV